MPINIQSCVDKAKEAIKRAKETHDDKDILGSYETCIINICNKIREANYALSIIDNNPPDYRSSTNHDLHLIRWHMRGASLGPNLIWDLLHELGHVILNKPENDKLEDPNWECQAWEKGWEFAISQCPALRIQRPSFETRGKKCVEGYKRKWAKKHRNPVDSTTCP